MGNELTEFYQDRIQKRWKTAFYSAFFLGLLIHIYKFTNLMPNHDGLYNFYSSQNMVASGRWFLSIACCLGSFFDLPWINGVLSLIFMGLTAAVIADIFDMENPCLIILSSGLLVSFPAITATMAYEFYRRWLYDRHVPGGSECSADKGGNAGQKALEVHGVQRDLHLPGLRYLPGLCVLCFSAGGMLFHDRAAGKPPGRKEILAMDRFADCHLRSGHGGVLFDLENMSPNPGICGSILSGNRPGRYGERWGVAGGISEDPSGYGSLFPGVEHPGTWRYPVFCAEYPVFAGICRGVGCFGQEK